MKISTLSPFLVAGLALATHPAAASYTLLHRISTFSSNPEWSVRGTLDLSSNTTFLTNALSESDTKALHDSAWQPDAGDRYYQIALRDGEDEVGFTSVRLCLLRQSHAELPTLDDELTVTTRNNKVTGLSYRVLDITLGDDGCPIASAQKMSIVLEARRKERQRQLSRRRSSIPPPPPASPALEFNTKLVRKHTRPAPRVTTKQAAPTNEDGTIQVPPPEKTFVQKYWYYAIPLVILLIMPDGGDERAQGAEGHASSEHRGTGMGAKKLN